MPDESPANEASAWYESILALVGESDGEWRWIAARLGGCTLLLLGCLVGLSVVGVGWRLGLGYALTAAGLVSFVETYGRRSMPRKPPPLPAAAAATPTPSEEPEASASAEQRNIEREDGERKARDAFEIAVIEARRRRSADSLRSLAEIVLLIGLAVSTGLFGRHLTRAAGLLAQNNTATRLSTCQIDLMATTSALQACRATTAPPPQGGPVAVTPSGPPTSSTSPVVPSSSTWRWWWLPLSLIALLVLGLVARKHKEAVPVAGAAALAIAALEHSGELVKMNDWMYCRALFTFLAVSSVLIALFLVAAIADIRRRHRKALDPVPGEPLPSEGALATWWHRLFGRPAKEIGEAKEDYLSSLGFSVAVLLWAVVMVGYRLPEPDRHTSTTSVIGKPLKSNALPPLRRFNEGQTQLQDENRHQALDTWTQGVAKAMHPGDMLLLLGSTDCKPFRKGGDGKGNPTLATDRAKAVRDWLRPIADARGVELDADSIAQHERCREAADLRAVFPFLIEPTSPEPSRAPVP